MRRCCSVIFSLFVIINFIVESLEINQKYRHYSNEVELKHPKVPFSTVAENAYKLALAQSRGQQHQKGRHKGRIRQRQQYSPTTTTTKALINARSSLINARSSLINAPSSLINAPSSLINAPSSLINARSSLINARSSLINAPSSLINAPSSLINAPSSLISAPSLPPSIASVVFDRGGGGQWQFPDHDHHHNPLEGNKKNGDGERVEEHSVVHLISRPTQLYYYGSGGGEGMENAMRNGHGGGGVGAEQQLASASVQVGFSQVCRVKVPTADVFYISYEDDERSGGGMGQRSFVDVFFHCSQYWAWCCGVDCCQLDPALVFTGACVLVVLCTLFVHCCLHSQLGQRVCVRRLFRMHRLRHKRVIARTNAQRRKSTVDGIENARGDVGISRKPSKTVSSGDAEQYRHQQQKQQRRSGGNLRRMLRNSIRETIGRGHRRLVRTGHQFRGDLLKNTRSVPEIVVTEPSSSCFEGEDEEEGRGSSMRR